MYLNYVSAVIQCTKNQQLIYFSAGYRQTGISIEIMNRWCNKVKGKKWYV